MKASIFNRTIVCLLALGLAACSQPIGRTVQGTAAGTALGAGLGAIVGNQAGNSGAGIAIGAAAGALGGALIGSAMEQRDNEVAAQRRGIEEQDRQIEENRRLIEELRRTGADVYSSSRGVVVNLPDVLFEFDRAELTAEARRTVGEIAGVVKNVRDRRISVEGHTDSVGSEAYNARLSDRRAQNVARELDYSGVAPAQMRAHGYGESQPIATNATYEGRARNRRVEVIIEN